jgi:hypothetical protein
MQKKAKWYLTYDIKKELLLPNFIDFIDKKIKTTYLAFEHENL